MVATTADERVDWMVDLMAAWRGTARAELRAPMAYWKVEYSVVSMDHEMAGWRVACSVDSTAGWRVQKLVGSMADT